MTSMPGAENLSLEPTVRLVASAQAGDEAARQALYERYHQRVLSIVRVRMGRKLRTRMESSDLVQSVFLESLKDLGKFEHRTEGAFLHWLSSLVEHKVRNKAAFFNAQKRDAGREEADAGEPHHFQTPSGLVERAEEVLRVEEAIGKLPKEQGEMVVMAILEGLTYEEIAELTGKTPDASRMAVARALVKITGSLTS